MDDLIQIQKQIIPEAMELMKKRYALLKAISLNEPVGRRLLSMTLQLSERTVRSETEFLKSKGLINISSSGMSITDEGLCLLEKLREYTKEIMGISILEEKLKNKLGISKVIISSGDCDFDESIKKDMSKNACKYFMNMLKDNLTIGITGGSTMYEFAKAFSETAKYKNILVVPARGGFAKEVETQSNNIAAILGKKLGGNYKLLHVPDNIGKDTIESLINEPDIRKTLEHINTLDILIFGIGRADEMAVKRKLTKNQIDYIKEKHGVGEAFGYYFDIDGKIVYEASTIGINLENFMNMKNFIAISGGSKKADSIVAISKINKNLVLVTDEGLTNEILKNY